MALGEIEVRLNAGKFKARINAHDLKVSMMEKLQLAKSADEVAEILEVAKKEAENQKGAIKGELADVLADAEKMANELPALKERMQEAIAYRDEILAEANKLLADASAGADLIAAVSGAHVQLDEVVTLLGKQGENCEVLKDGDNDASTEAKKDCIKKALGSADGAAEAVYKSTELKMALIVIGVLGEEYVKQEDRQKDDLELFAEQSLKDIKRRISRTKSRAIEEADKAYDRIQQSVNKAVQEAAKKTAEDEAQKRMNAAKLASEK